ncbi:uncharacterized protein TEOVI_000045000 [Trypanosoma equiperdum]|uniref:RNA-binding protein n=2 Tax=Trypanozoon TaxID=39700 RepID=Q38FY3_TRYB2|nr:hypothetical protein, conserved [Trypanosoma brucei brucei TREU927]EAN76287.1 hypothetical protein, conserved [Trypanosoma brucei brucei TREU927]SCU67490.1 hypothetical protein, conserved [Trypanosoma equiperdum]
MTLDLVGKLHRTIYVDGCPSAFYEDFVRLLATKCGPIEGWDVADRLIVIFSSLNSVSTALTFSGTAFGDLTSSVTVWVANQPPPPNVVQQVAITSGGNGKAIEEAKAAKEARERRLATIRAELAEDIERDKEEENVSVKLRRLCLRQLRALCVLTSHALREVEESLEQSTLHLNSMKQLVDKLKTKGSSHGPADPDAHQSTSVPTSFTRDAANGGEKRTVTLHVGTADATVEDVGKGQKRPRSE